MTNRYAIAALVMVGLSGQATAQDSVVTANCDMGDIADLRARREPTGLTCVITPPIAVMAAAATAPGAIGGTFVMTVRASATIGDILYLNSEEDYRDPRSISVDIPPAVAKQLTAQWGSAPGVFLKDRMIRLKGYARTVKIYFLSNGRVTDKYYYQTHFDLQSPQQIEVLEAN